VLAKSQAPAMVVCVVSFDDARIDDLHWQLDSFLITLVSMGFPAAGISDLETYFI
jgi:hypothetical protein